jgi:hypothetical protein
MHSQYTVLMVNLTKHWLSSEACDGEVEGCSETEIAEIMQPQGVQRLPLMYVEFLARMGRKAGGLEWHFGSEFTYPAVLSFKPMAVELWEQTDIFIFTHDSQGDCAIYFHITEDDPIVYWVGYDGDGPDPNQFYLSETRELGRLSDWLTNLFGGVVEEHNLLKKPNVLRGVLVEDLMPKNSPSLNPPRKLVWFK